MKGVIIDYSGVLVPQLQQTVPHFGGIYGVIGFRLGIALHHRYKFAVFEIATVFKTVQQHLKGIKGRFKIRVFFLELLSGGSSEQKTSVLGIQLNAH